MKRSVLTSFHKKKIEKIFMKTSVLTFPPHFPKKNSYDTDVRFPGMPEVPEELPESFSTKKIRKVPGNNDFSPEENNFHKNLVGDVSTLAFIKTISLSRTSVHCIS